MKVKILMLEIRLWTLNANRPADEIWMQKGLFFELHLCYSASLCITNARIGWKRRQIGHILAAHQRSHPAAVIDPQERAHSPQLAVGLASELQID